MRSIAEFFGLKRPADGIPPSARPALYRPDGQYARHPEYVPLRLPAENPNLLLAYPTPVDENGVPRPRPACLILGASRTEHERVRRTAALAAGLSYEAAVAENLLILHPEDTDSAAYLELLNAALPVVTDSVTLPLAVTS